MLKEGDIPEEKMSIQVSEASKKQEIYKQKKVICFKRGTVQLERSQLCALKWMTVIDSSMGSRNSL